MNGYQAPVATEEYVVTLPNGTVQVFEDEGSAYRALRLTGGGVQRRPKTT